MPLEAIKLVTEAEQYAQRVRTDTQTKIRKIKTDGEQEGREMIELAISRALEETRRVISDAEIRADRHSEKVLEQSRLECEALKERASGRLDKAVELIVERIVVT